MNCSQEHLLQRLVTKLIQRQENFLYRERKLAAKKMLSFCTNDYLGLANHPSVVQAAKSALDDYGVGGKSAQLLYGYTKNHQILEEELAQFLGYEKVLLFSTGYMANLGVITALCENSDQIFIDKLAHASLIDGSLYSGAKVSRFLHKNIIDLKNKLQNGKSKVKLIISDGVFSINGDCADLPELIQTANNSESILMLDDAHGIGVLGKNGKGLIEFSKVNSQDIPILIGTFGKAFGTFGAFVASSNTIIAALIQYARSYIYTTALPQAIAAATYASLQIIKKETWRRDYLTKLINELQFKAKQLNLNILPSFTPIQSIAINDAKKTLKISQQLQEKNILVNVIRPPTVPPNKSCIRISLNVNHTVKQIDYLLEQVKRIYLSIKAR